jgi:hypothetical protein
MAGQGALSHDSGHHVMTGLIGRVLLAAVAAVYFLILRNSKARDRNCKTQAAPSPFSVTGTFGGSSNKDDR